MKAGVRLVAMVALPVLAAGWLVAARLSADESHREKAERFAEKMGYMDRIRSMVRREIDGRSGGDAKKVEQNLAKVNWKPLFEFLTDEVERNVDEKSLDELLPYLDTPEGARHLKLLRASGSMLNTDLLLVFTRINGNEELRLLDERFKKAWDDSTRKVEDLGIAQNEIAAIATLRNLTACQAMIQTAGKIDCDQDGIGEFGTLLELTGKVGVRNHPGEFSVELQTSDFSKQGSPVSPAILAASLSNVDGNGVVVKSGYCFRMLLPDDATPGGFTGERGPAEKVSLVGGTGRIYTDLAEQTWCAYAWPEERGVTGNRVFFVNQSGDVTESQNQVAKWSGPANAPKGNSAFRTTSGGGITGRMAIGVVGMDGDVWKVTN